MKNKFYDFKNWHLIKGVILSSLGLIISIVNIFVDSTYLHGVWLGLTFYLLVDLILNGTIISHNQEVELQLIKEGNKELMIKCGFREDFDWETRFDLKKKVGKYRISTVDLGLGHSFGIGEPLYYETMIFSDDEENPFEYYQERYTTEEEARKGHKKAIKYVKEHLKEDYESR